MKTPPQWKSYTLTYNIFCLLISSFQYNALILRSLYFVLFAFRTFGNKLTWGRLAQKYETFENHMFYISLSFYHRFILLTPITNTCVSMTTYNVNLHMNCHFKIFYKQFPFWFCNLFHNLQKYYMKLNIVIFFSIYIFAHLQINYKFKAWYWQC